MPIDESPEHDRDCHLDHWLEDSGRRKHSAEWVVGLYAQAPIPPATSSRQRGRYITQPGLLLLFATAALTFAMRDFIEVQLAIASLRRVIVFVALK